nr:UDP-N-acetylmuramate dehydrogenase [secondary endosymbiont of Heteropsylla cubana]
MTNTKNLKPLNSFSINISARHIVEVHNEAELYKVWKNAENQSTPTLMLGRGTNVLFLENYTGIVLLNRIAGIEIEEQHQAWNLHVGAGEIWDNLVRTCLSKKIPGLENLALIPGCVGAAPIHNIGAYGVEFCQFCNYVDVLHLKTGTLLRLNTNECQFGYRDSIFKHTLRDNHAIVRVGFQLLKSWNPTLTYGVLKKIHPQHATPQLIYDTICMIRRTTLPDPVLTGNAGSFFKNPIINAGKAKQLLKEYPDAPNYLQPEGKIKLAAGWLIDQCGLKGYRIGGAATYDKQALILINFNNATSKDITTLARYIRKKVEKKFAILLEPEVRFIGPLGEVDGIAEII